MSRSATDPARKASVRCAALAALFVAAMVTAIFVSAGVGALMFLIVLGIGALGGGAPKGDPSRDGSKSPYMFGGGG